MRENDDDQSEMSLEQLQALRNQISPPSIPAPMALPNGGATGQGLQNLIAQNPGPEATTGFNPSAALAKLKALPSISSSPSAKEDSDEEETDSSGQRVPASEGQSNQPKTIAEMLKSLTDPNNAEYQKAVDQRNDMQQRAAFGMGADRIGAAIAGVKNEESPVFSNMMKNAGQGVTDLTTKNQLAMDKLKQQDEASKLLQEQQDRDPTSQGSVFARAIGKKVADQLGLKINISDQMSKADIDKLLQGSEKYATAMASVDARNTNRQLLQDNRQNQALGQVTQAIESMRGAKDAQNAKETMRLVDNANSLMAEYPNLDKMPKAQVNLLVTELSKIASGGVASHEEFKEIAPQSVFANIMSGVSKLGDQPTGAQLGAFLQQYKPYLNQLKQNSQGLISGRTDRILKANAPRIGDSNVNNLRTIYGLDQGQLAPPSHSPSEQQEMYQKNKKTGQMRMSKDGGKTWSIVNG